MSNLIKQQEIDNLYFFIEKNIVFLLIRKNDYGEDKYSLG